MSTALRLARLGRHHDPSGDEARATAAAALAALRVADLLAHDELSCSQLARRLVADPQRLSQVLDAAEAAGLVHLREGRYSLTRAGEHLRVPRWTGAPGQRRTALA